MPAFAQRIADFFGAHDVPRRDEHERDRVRQRTAICVLFAGAALWAMWHNGEPGAAGVAVVAAGYAVASLLYGKFFLSRPGRGVLAQYLFVVLDSVLSVIALVGAATVLGPFYPLLIVQIVRVGMRYGLRTMWLAWTAAALAALALVPLSPFWMTETQLLRSFFVTMLVTPVLLGPLVRTLHRVTDELRSAAGADPLTGLGNRRLLDEHLGLARERSRRDGTMLAVVAFDLDNFKRVNDRLGHAAGDALIVRVAQTIRASCRAGDFVARVGGDEFVLLLEGLPALGARGRRAHRHEDHRRRAARGRSARPGQRGVHQRRRALLDAPDRCRRGRRRVAHRCRPGDVRRQARRQGAGAGRRGLTACGRDRDRAQAAAVGLGVRAGA